MPVDKRNGTRVNMRVRPVRSQTKTGGAHFTEIFHRMNKPALRAAIVEQLRRELAAQVGAALLAREEAISEESRPDSKYDTHGQEAAYLAEGQARIAAEIEASLAHYAALPLPDFEPTDAIALGALIELGTESRSSAWYFLGPRAGGIELQWEDRKILVVTPQSPLGRQLLGHHAGETVRLPGRGGLVAQKILAVK